MSADNQQDTLDTVLSQAVVCAYAIPGAGAFIAAGFSIVQAVYDAFGKDHPPPQYSTAQAIADLGEEIAKEIGDQETDDRLTTVQSWQLTIKATNQDIIDWPQVDKSNQKEVDGAYSQIDNFVSTVSDDAYNEIFSWFENKKDQDDIVQSLPIYFMARTAYHSQCLAMLQYSAVMDGKGGEQWMQGDIRVRSRFEASLKDGVKKTQSIVANLDDAFQHSEARALKKATADHPDDARARNMAFAKELRRLRAAAGLGYTSFEQVKQFQTFIAAYQATTHGLNKHPHEASPAPAPANTGKKRQLVPGSLGTKAANMARFLYETTATTWVDVVADSPVVKGSLATQNAGSTNPGIYYQVDGGFLNGAFKSKLTQAGQIQAVNKALKTAYDTKYGAGSFAADAAASSPRQDRLTSLIIPLTPGAPPVGNHVYAMVYSVGPMLGASGITDTQGYKQIYLDALTGIAAWNKQHPPAAIQNFRITMLSTNAYAGTGNKETLRQQAAGLIIDAVKEAMQADSSLQSLQILINTNDSQASSERDAFDAAAKSKGLNPIGEGFDVPLTG